MSLIARSIHSSEAHGSHCFAKLTGLQDKHVLFGAAFERGIRKEPDAFEHLAGVPDERYRMASAGVNGNLRGGFRRI